LDEYKVAGLKFWGITTGNEPMNGIIPINRFNSLGWSPLAQRTWIGQNLGPALRASQHNSTKLLALDDQRFLLPWWIQLVTCNLNS
jgi:glucosylceramidase